MREARIQGNLPSLRGRELSPHRPSCKYAQIYYPLCKEPVNTLEVFSGLFLTVHLVFTTGAPIYLALPFTHLFCLCEGVYYFLQKSLMLSATLM